MGGNVIKVPVTIELSDEKENKSKAEEILVKEEIVIESEKSPHKSFNIFEKIKNKFHFEKYHSDENVSENVAFVDEMGRIFYIDIDGSYKDIKGRAVNEKGELIDADGNILEINIDEEVNIKPDKEFLAKFKNIFDWKGRKLDTNELGEGKLIVEQDDVSHKFGS